MTSPSLRARIKTVVARVVRGVLLRYVRVRPSTEDRAGADRAVFILLWKAYEMGGTVRAALNLAEYLAERGYDVELISGVRDRDTSFFGDFPAGVRVTVLDDRRECARPRRAAARLLRRVLRSRSSLFMPGVDRASAGFSLWTDIALVRRLRGRSGFLLCTRPGINIMAARLGVPGLTTIGLEQMNLSSHPRGVRRAIKRRYPSLDALVVLTDADMHAYNAHLGGNAPPLRRIPNTVRPLPGAKADLASRTIYAAGRFRYQKGFDLLIPAFATVAARHPDWRLRLRGTGRLRERLETLIDDHGLDGVVTLEGPAEDIGADMAKASLFVLSSRFEGFPLILIEAMSKGMGVVSFDCPTGPSDIVEDHRNGLLVPRADVDALAAAMLEMIEDEPLRRRCAAAAVESAQRYTLEAIGPKWLELLQTLREPPVAHGTPFPSRPTC
jgi:glycosyltransferase involved in cell wall biosynthesis